LQGKIEQLAAAGIAPGSVDLIISNCVINLSPDKGAVLREAYQALAEGGEVFFSGERCIITVYWILEGVYCRCKLPAQTYLLSTLHSNCSAVVF
jgi:SAM-dependent methyltransferase